MSNFFPFPKYFQYISILRSHIKLHTSFVKCGSSIYFFFSSTNLIFQSRDMSKYFRESFWLRDKESTVYVAAQDIFISYRWMDDLWLTFVCFNRISVISRWDAMFIGTPCWIGKQVWWLTSIPGCLRSGPSRFNWWVSFAPDFQFCYFGESSCLIYLNFNSDSYVSKIMHLWAWNLPRKPNN